LNIRTVFFRCMCHGVREEKTQMMNQYKKKKKPPKK